LSMMVIAFIFLSSISFTKSPEFLKQSCQSCRASNAFQNEPPYALKDVQKTRYRRVHKSVPRRFGGS